MKYFAIVISFCFGLFSQANAQAPALRKGLELSEITQMLSAYSNYDNLSFDAVFQYADSAAPTTILQTMNGQYKMNLGKYWSMIDSTEFLQGNGFSLNVYHREKLIFVTAKKPTVDLLKLPVLDSFFTNANTDSIYSQSVNDTTRAIKMRFKDVSSYYSYEVQYDYRNYLIRKVIYGLRQPIAANQTLSGKSIITMTITNYATTKIAPEFFEESKFISTTGSRVSARAAYSTYEVVAGSN
jgi:hypothetical protein